MIRNHIRRLAATTLAVTLSLLLARTAQAQAGTPDKGQQLVQAGQYEEAAEWFLEQTKSKPDDARAWFMYGYSLHAAGKLEEAIKIHRRAALFPAVRPIATYNLGCAQALLGRTDDAFDTLFVAVELGTVNPEQWKQDSDLESLHTDERWTKLMKRVKELTEHPPDQALRFWVGEWDVYNASGTKVGENSIALRSNGRMIFESWKSAGGGVGESINYFEPVSRRWKQAWVDGSGNVIEMEGIFIDGALRYEGTELHRDGQIVLHKTTLTPLPGGRVQQFIENSKDEGLSWQTVYDLTYVPKGQPFAQSTS